MMGLIPKAFRPVQPTLVPSDIDQAKLPKKAKSILQKCDRLVEYYKQHPTKPPRIVLYREDYRYLAATLELTGQDIRRATYRGFRLEQ